MRRTGTPFDIVVIAASFGGIRAIKGLLAALPLDFGPSIVIAQHLPREHPTILVDVLRVGTSLMVKWAEDDEHLRRNTIYVAPARSSVVINAARSFVVTPSPHGRLGLPPADPLFESVARRFGPRAIAVVLTGLLSDGARGIAMIKRAGGRVILQDEESALAPDMPRAARATGAYDFIFRVDSIAAALITLTMVPGAAATFHVPLAPAPIYLSGSRVF